MIFPLLVTVLVINPPYGLYLLLDAKSFLKKLYICKAGIPLSFLNELPNDTAS
jgi:hypothetical protein